MENFEDPPEKKKRLWPFDGAMTISVIALVISAIQFIVTAPLLGQLFVSPNLVIAAKQMPPGDGSISGAFVVENTGNAPATNIEIGLITQISDTYLFFPNVVTDMREWKGDEIIFQNRVLKLDRLLPGEQMTILVLTGARTEPEIKAAKDVSAALK